MKISLVGVSVSVTIYTYVDVYIQVNIEDISFFSHRKSSRWNPIGLSKISHSYQTNTNDCFLFIFWSGTFSNERFISHDFTWTRIN